MYGGSNEFGCQLVSTEFGSIWSGIVQLESFSLVITTKALENFIEFGDTPGIIESRINESEDLNWADEAANEVPEIRFDDLMVGDVISYAGSPEEKRRYPKGTPEARFNYEETLYHVLSFEDGTTWRNSYQEPEKYMICSLVRLDSDTGNFLSVSR